MYTKDSYKNPFWAENSGFMTGRDPLGIQNSSITVYGLLLPGMTNLTLRLRYYGFYCWLLAEYEKLHTNQEKKTIQHHYNFIRRAELALAFITLVNHPGQSSIVGSMYVNDNLNEINSLGYYDIYKGADKERKAKNISESYRVYWDYISGALGQYYLGSLINLDLVEVSEHFILIKNKGKKLAEAFSENISRDNQSMFLSIVELGRLDQRQIESLEQFAINSIKTESDEWNVYNEILIEKDGDRFKTYNGSYTSNRKTSIKLYLEYWKENNKHLSFPRTQYTMVSKSEYTSTRFGWYYYFINEAIHYCIETLFWALLVELDGNQMALKDFIDHMTSLINSETQKYGFKEDHSIKDILSNIDEIDLIDEINILEKLTKSELNNIEASSLSIKLLFHVYISISDNIEEMKSFENLYGLNNQKGVVTEHMKVFIDDLISYNYSSYLAKVVKIIINDHISTAYRKMGNGESNLLKFIIEDGVIGHIQTMQPKFTNPRTRTLHNFLSDLSYINENGLTEKGNNFLESLN
jgi:hypothetical protein